MAAFMDVADTGKKQDKFVTAEPGNGVAGAHALAQALRYFDQQTVTGGMAVFIIHRFEAVEIKVADGQHFFVALGLRHRQLQAVSEQNAVGQLGQGVKEIIIDVF